VTAPGAPTRTTRIATRRSASASRPQSSAAAACSARSLPYFLWTGVPEVGAKAPLLNAAPEIVFQPRAAAFGAAVYMQRILKNYRVDDIADIKAGWANPSLLTTGRGSENYKNVRSRFLADVQTVGIDLNDATIPAKLDASAWPGVPAVFARLVGKGFT
jgi:hypothetical protein